jgi:hypothetical protein
VIIIIHENNKQIFYKIHYFCIADEAEKEYVENNYPGNVWRYEFPAWKVVNQ